MSVGRDRPAPRGGQEADPLFGAAPRRRQGSVRRWPPLGPILLVAPLLACASCAPGSADSEAPDEALTFDTVDSAGVQLSRNHGSAPRWLEPEEEVRIGVREGPDEDMLNGVVALDTRADGSVLVGMVTKLRIYGPDGRFVREMGGPGDGPGEFRMIASVAWTGEGTGALDLAARKIVLFSGEGALGDVLTMREVSMERLDVVDGHLLGRVPDWGRPGDSGQRGRRKASVAHLYEIDPSTGERSTPLAELPSGTFVTLGGSPEALPSLFDTVTYHVVAGPDRIVGARGPDYDIEVRSFGGALLRRITRDFEPVPLGSEAFERYREIRERLTRGGPVREADLARFPDFSHIPPVRYVAPARGGGYWAERQDLYADPILKFGGAFSDFQAEGPVYDVFDGDGRYVGSVRLPPTFRALEFASRQVTGVERDDLGVEYVVTYGITP